MLRLVRAAGHYLDETVTRTVTHEPGESMRLPDPRRKGLSTDRRYSRLQGEPRRLRTPKHAALPARAGH